jgi:hypothetical protein
VWWTRWSRRDCRVHTPSCEAPGGPPRAAPNAKELSTGRRSDLQRQRAPCQADIARDGPCLDEGLPSHLHRLWIEAESVAVLGEMPEARPGQVIDERQHFLRHQHIHGLDARRHALLRIGVECDLHAWVIDQDQMVHEVAGEKQRLVARIHHEAGVTDGVAGHVHRLNARDSREGVSLQNAP